MAKVTKNIGKLPVHKGAWVSGTAYAKLNQVTHEGSCLQSKVDNNTATPITIDMLAGTFAVHASWQLISDGTTAKIAAQKATEAKDQIAADIMTRQSVFHGLGFKAGDNSVNIKCPSINLGTDDFTLMVWAKMKGCNVSLSTPLTSFSKSFNTSNTITISCANSQGVAPFGSNGIYWIGFERPLEGLNTLNSISVNKADDTYNHHCFIIKRQGTRVVCKVNGRLVKELIQDRVLDFNDLRVEFANTDFFSICRLENFYTTDAHDDELWNGGRCDEVVLDRGLFSYIGYKHTADMLNTASNYSVHNLTTNSTITIDSDNWVNIKGVAESGASGSSNRVQYNPSTHALRTDKLYYVKVKMKNKLNKGVRLSLNAGTSPLTVSTGTDLEYIGVIKCGDNSKSYGLMIYFNSGYGEDVDFLFKIEYLGECNCLLELLPQNIHSAGIYNSGSLGSSHDAVLSKPAETIFHKERPYKDKQMISGAPAFHPIAMGQKVYSAEGLIYEASVPPPGEEWGVKHWKQINNA